MNIVARIKLCCNLKNSSSSIGYYSYTNRWRAFKMKKLLYILAILLFGCNNNGQVRTNNDKTIQKSQKGSTIQKTINIPIKILAAKRFEFKNPDIPIEDTLILKTDKKEFQITPLGLFKTNSNDTIHLATDLIIDRAYLYETDEHFYVFFTDTDHEGATSWIQKISKTTLKSEYVEQIQGFNLGQPIIDGQSAYVNAIGFVGKFNLKTGQYDWKHYNLYDNEKYSFNSFDTVFISTEKIEFISENYRSKKVDKVIIDNQTGEIEDIIK